MNRTQLIKTVADLTGKSQNNVRDVIEATLVTIETQLSLGNEVKLMGFGAFRTRDRKETVSKLHGKTTTIAARRVASFKPGLGLKNAVA